MAKIIMLLQLLTAIEQVESDRGATSKNLYQIRRVYVDDVNRIQEWNERKGDMIVGTLPRFTYEDVTSRDKSREMIRIYWAFYGDIYTRTTGKPLSYEVLARMHNGGGENGWRRACTVPYWGKVKRELEKAGVNCEG